MPKGLNRPVADCHPEQKHYAKGLCFNCYRRDYYATNPEWRDKVITRVKEYAKVNPDKIAVRNKRYYAENRDRVLSECRRYYYQNHSRVRFRRKLQLAGCSEEKYNRMMVDQDGKCAICSRRKPLVIDHCHKTGIVRGLLCTRCNCGIGILEDSAVVLGLALRYLSQTQPIKEN